MIVATLLPPPPVIFGKPLTEEQLVEARLATTYDNDGMPVLSKAVGAGVRAFIAPEVAGMLKNEPLPKAVDPLAQSSVNIALGAGMTAGTIANIEHAVDTLQSSIRAGDMSYVAVQKITCSIGLNALVNQTIAKMAQCDSPAEAKQWLELAKQQDAFAKQLMDEGRYINEVASNTLQVQVAEASRKLRK